MPAIDRPLSLFVYTCRRLIDLSLSLCIYMPAIDSSLSDCRHDVLYPDLTVEQHIHMYARLKGIPEEHVSEKLNDVVAAVGLTEKLHTKSSALSGGMKRKLSLSAVCYTCRRLIDLSFSLSLSDCRYEAQALALKCARWRKGGLKGPLPRRAYLWHGPVRVVLDRCCLLKIYTCRRLIDLSNDCRYSRRSTWNMLQTSREGRTIILTTHFMGTFCIVKLDLMISHSN